MAWERGYRLPGLLGCLHAVGPALISGCSLIPRLSWGPRPQTLPEVLSPGSPWSLVPRLSRESCPQALPGASSPGSPGSLVPRLSHEPCPHALQSQLICLPFLSDSIRGAGRRLPILEYTLHITSSSPTELRAAGFVHWHVPHWGFRKEEYAPSQTSSASRTSKSSPASSKG